MKREDFIKYKSKELKKEGYSNSQISGIANSMFNKAQQGAQVNTATTNQNQMDNYALLRASIQPGFGVDSGYRPDLRTPEQQQEDYLRLRASIKPGFNVDSGYRPDLRSPEQQQEDYRIARGQQKTPTQNNSVVGNIQQGGNYMQFGGMKLPEDIGYNFNPQLTTQYAYQNPYNEQNYQLPQNSINNNGFQYNPSAVDTSNPSDILQKQEVSSPVTAQDTQGQQIQYNDITRYNIPNLYGGMDLESSLAYAGQGFGSGNAYQAGMGTGLSVLKGARNFLTGYSSGKESERVKKEQYDDLYNPKINYAYAQEGTEVKNSELLTGQYAVDESRGNYTLEGNEYLKRAKTGDVQEVIGAPHIKNGKEAEGVKLTLEDGDKVLSDYTKIPAKNVKELKERYSLSLRKNATFADAQKAFDKKLGIQEETDNLASLIEKFGKNSTVNDETTKRLNDLTLSKQIEVGKKKLDLLGTPQSMMFDDLFQMQEKIEKKGKPGELLDKNGKVVEGTENIAQQGGELATIAEKYGITLARAHELLTMQTGGEANQQQTEQAQPTQEQVMQFVAQSLQSGANPQEVLQQLIQNGIPQEAAQQIVGQVMQQLQESPQQEGQAQDQNSQGESIEQEAPQQMAQEGVQAKVPQETGFSFATRYAPPVAGYDVTGRSVLNQDVLSGVEEMQPYYSAKGYGAKMANVEDTIKLHDWYFNTDEKKNAFREASKKQGKQPEVEAFQKAYNEELVKRADSAGVPKTEVNDIISKVGFSDKGVQNVDGKFGAFTSTRPLYDFKKVDGEVKTEVTPIEAVQTPNVEQRNITKNVLPWLPQDLRLAPSSIDPLHKEQIALPRAEAVKLTPEPQLAEAERLRQSDVARVQASGLSPVQQEALLSQGLASSQMAANNAIAQTEQANQASQQNVEQFNINQAAKEQITNANFNQVYQNQVLGGLNAYERDWRNYLTEGNLQNRANYKAIEDINLINAENENYQYLPSMGVQYINTPTTNLALSRPTDEWYKNATPEEAEIFKKAREATDRINNLKKYKTTKQTP